MTARRRFQAQELSREEREECVEHARRVLISFAEGVQRLAEVNRPLLEAQGIEYTFTASGAVRNVGIHSVTVCDVDVSDGTKLRFDALAARIEPDPNLVFSGAGTFLHFPPGELIGDCRFQAGWDDVNTVMGMNWHKGNKLAGVLTSWNAFSSASGSLEGSGTWTYLPDGS